MKHFLANNDDGRNQGACPMGVGIKNWQHFSSALLLSHSPFPVLLFATLFLLSACDDTFVPLTENPTNFFALYGFLDSNADTQFVRVSPVRPLLDPASYPTDIRVFSTRVGTDQRIAWRDSLVLLDDGTTGLLFYAPLRAKRGATYLLEVLDTEEHATKTITEVPPALSVRVDSLSQPFEFIQYVTWLNQRQLPLHTTIHYTVAPSPGSSPVEVTLPVSDIGKPTANGWTFAINLSRDRNTLLRQLNLPPADSSVILFNLEMKIEQRSKEWLNPNTPSNIQNGFGFWGAVSTSIDRWTLDPDEAQMVGFSTPSSRSH